MAPPPNQPPRAADRLRSASASTDLAADNSPSRERVEEPITGTQPVDPARRTVDPAGPVESGEAIPADPAQLLPLVYGQMRQLAQGYLHRNRGGHTLQPTAVVHEAYIRLARQPDGSFKSREHFLAVAATAMRQILTDHARRKQADKRGGGAQQVTLSDVVADPDSPIDVLDLEAALTKLGAVNERHRRLVELRLLAGCTIPEAASVLGVSERTVVGDWRFVKAWLRRELGL